jgi:hypothetical protein
MAALSLAARILRLKGLGGIVVFDLVGRGHDGQALVTAARNAFAADNPGSDRCDQQVRHAGDDRSPPRSVDSRQAAERAR